MLQSSRRFNEIEGKHLALVISLNLFVAVIPLLILGYAFLEAFNPNHGELPGHRPEHRMPLRVAGQVGQHHPHVLRCGGDLDRRRNLVSHRDRSEKARVTAAVRLETFNRL